MKPDFHHAIIKGFTLIEMMIVLIALISLVIATIPIYSEARLAVRRAEARSALYQLMLQQERNYTQYQTYQKLDINTEYSNFKWWSGEQPESSYYSLTATVCPAQPLTQCVLLTATPGTPLRKFSDPECGQLSIDSAGHQRSSGKNHSCW